MGTAEPKERHEHGIFMRFVSFFARPGYGTSPIQVGRYALAYALVYCLFSIAFGLLMSKSGLSVEPSAIPPAALGLMALIVMGVSFGAPLIVDHVSRTAGVRSVDFNAYIAGQLKYDSFLGSSAASMVLSSLGIVPWVSTHGGLPPRFPALAVLSMALVFAAHFAWLSVRGLGLLAGEPPLDGYLAWKNSKAGGIPIVGTVTSQEMQGMELVVLAMLSTPSQGAWSLPPEVEEGISLSFHEGGSTAERTAYGQAFLSSAYAAFDTAASSGDPRIRMAARELVSSLATSLATQAARRKGGLTGELGLVMTAELDAIKRAVVNPESLLMAAMEFSRATLSALPDIERCSYAAIPMMDSLAQDLAEMVPGGEHAWVDFASLPCFDYCLSIPGLLSEHRPQDEAGWDTHSLVQAAARLPQDGGTHGLGPEALRVLRLVSATMAFESAAFAAFSSSYAAGEVVATYPLWGLRETYAGCAGPASPIPRSSRAITHGTVFRWHPDWIDRDSPARARLLFSEAATVLVAHSLACEGSGSAFADGDWIPATTATDGFPPPRPRHNYSRPRASSRMLDALLAMADRSGRPVSRLAALRYLDRAGTELLAGMASADRIRGELGRPDIYTPTRRTAVRAAGRDAARRAHAVALLLGVGD